MLEQVIQNQYLRAAVIFAAVFILIKIFSYVVMKILPKITQKTRTSVDDEILKKSSTPLTFIAFLIGLRIAILEISFFDRYSFVINGIIMTLIILAGSMIVYYIFDLIIIVGFSKIQHRTITKLIDESLIQFFQSVLKIVIAILAFLAILSSWGIQIGPLLAGLGIAGIAVAFALQSTLSNVFGGISMLLDDTINVGDVVKLSDGTSGKIEKISLRSTKIRTFDNELIIVPNGKLSESNVQNIALPEPKARVVVPFGVAYGSDVEKVKRIVMAEIKKVKHFIPEPEPSVKFLEMADSSLNFKAFFYVDSYENRYTALDEANTRIYNALNRNRIEIPFPQMDVHLKKDIN